MAPDNKGSHDSTWKQASKLMAILRVPPDVQAEFEGVREPALGPRLEVGQEFRFALVMYGGVSLAIYINGVAQEFLRLVRSTAADPADPNRPCCQTRTSRAPRSVYRKAAQLIGRDRDGVVRPWTDNDPIRARFVVDILSGTSAGGINAIYPGESACQQPIDRRAEAALGRRRRD